MVNKLQIVRIDDVAVTKVDLYIGDNIIGRGVATGHVDNPIVEQAVTINLAPTGLMTMTPMLACYMKSRLSNRWQSLKIGCTVAVETGDICSLLPDKSWFKIISNDYDVMENDNDLNCKRKSTDSTEDEPPDKKSRRENDVETIYSQTQSVFDEWDKEVAVPDEEDTSSTTNNVPSANKNTNSSSTTTGNPSVEVISTSNTKTTPTKVSTSNTKTTPTKVSPSSVAQSSKNEGNASANNEETSSDNRDETGKKIKWDCGSHFSDQTDQQTSETNENSQKTSTAAENSPAGAAETSAEEPPRNRCTYGSQCYRQNSDHRTRFSHPGDSDYDVEDTRPECPYGVRCYRKNPQHKRDFKHTKNRRSRAQTPVRVRPSDDTSGNEHSSAEESVDESDYEPSLYDGTSDEYLSEFDDKSDFDGTSDCDDQ